MRCITKVAVVDAVRLPLRAPDTPQWFRDAEDGGILWFLGDGTVRFKSTHHGVSLARDGDWIIRQFTGEVHPCSALAFASTYEPVE